MKIICAHCGKEADKPTGAVTRSRKLGWPIYCDRACAGLARRNWKSDEQKKREKAAYDAEYRRKNRAMLRRKKAEYFQRTYDPDAARIERKKKMRKHVEYCRRPEYKAYKREYDRMYRAERDYGEYAECFLLTQEIRNECLSQQTDYEIRRAQGTFGKAQQRRRDYDRTHSNEPEAGALGHPGRIA